MIVLMIVGAIRFAPLNILGAIAAVLGGVVLYGSNSTTWKETTAEIEAAEARRAALIDGLAMRDARTLH